MKNHQLSICKARAAGMAATTFQRKTWFKDPRQLRDEIRQREDRRRIQERE